MAGLLCFPFPSFPLLLLLLSRSILSHVPLRWTVAASQDPCDDGQGGPNHCLPEFINAAFGRSVETRGEEPGISENVTSLTDLHNPHNLTCVHRRTNQDHTLTISLGRRFELTYISLQFCSGLQNFIWSVSILKSMDFGKTWRPFQFYSPHCLAQFGRPAQTVVPSRTQESEALCSDPRPLQQHRGGMVLAFAILDGRPSASDYDFSSILQDWATATDIRIVFHKVSDSPGGTGVRLRDTEVGSSRSREGLGGKRRASRRGDGVRFGGKEKMKNSIDFLDGMEELGNRKSSGIRAEAGLEVKETPRRRNKKTATRGDAAEVSVPSAPWLSLSDVQVGGRCKCNGHASRCRRDPEGGAACECRHNTAGPDCDVCKPFYCDRPWQRASPGQPHHCVSCQCNLHSTRCRFNMELYQLSGRRSGGVCLGCRHNTAGRHCHYCKEGFTRDQTKLLTHRKACKPCSCHPVGALEKGCNQTSGQCRCRDGVTGLTCNRCAPGYQQSRSPLRPCTRIEEIITTTPAYPPQHSLGGECSAYCQPTHGRVRMNLRTYCQKDYVLKVQVQAMVRSGPWWHFSVSVQSVFRRGTPGIRKGIRAVWVPERDLACGCPPLQVGRTYLLISSEIGPDENRVVADRTSLALPWRDHWSPKLRGFRTQDRRGRCKAEGPHKPRTRPTEPPN
ncbi:netrin-1-like isoform X1 [Acipenser oxyrinchus oxyrinchus]|uniref:Netrin-1-like isoform X1 n=1 Tax=Acipenser oxyrinchus oxyrinchus TaxID=40147 RepID=A0AAD8CNV8_ACIOX|nr:netrin-1-like isoform X1 [Acipenser oxyrinchus oxyrinchus]